MTLITMLLDPSFEINTANTDVLSEANRWQVTPREFIGMRGGHVEDLCNLWDGQQAARVHSRRFTLSMLSGQYGGGQPGRGASLKRRQRGNDSGHTLYRQSVDRVHRRQRQR